MKSKNRAFTVTRGICIFAFLILLVFFLVSTGCSHKLQRSIKNIETFTRLYGYVKYFYPGDEAAAMDWERFAIYGIKQVEHAPGSAELKKVLEELFLPIAPTLVIHESHKKTEFSIASITPPNEEGMKLVAWQHLGVGFGEMKNIYKSVRINRKNEFSASYNFGIISNWIDAAPYRGKTIKLRAAVKVAEGRGQLWLRVDREKEKRGFFDNMDDRPIQSNQWNHYEITGNVAEDAKVVYYGCFLKGFGALWVDDFQMYVKEGESGDTWKPVIIRNPGFEEDEEESTPKEWWAVSPGYSSQVTALTAAKGSKSVSIKSKSNTIPGSLPGFDEIPKMGEYVSKDLGASLSCLLPIVLLGTEAYTYPQPPKQEWEKLKTAIKKEVPGELSGDDRYVRLADICITWNIFQHFYPYFDVVKTDWKAALTEALKDAYQDKTQKDFLKTLRKFTAKLNDGHVRVYLKGDTRETYLLPIRWDWIENQLVITDIYDQTLANIHIGDVVAEINGITAKEARENEEQYISAATEGWRRYRSLYALRVGEKDAEFHLKIKRDGKIYDETLHASLSVQEYYNLSKKDAVQSKKIGEDIYYLNLDVISMDKINQLMPELEKANAIICDLRGYPNNNNEFIQHLLKEGEYSKWMFVPQVIYPDYKKVTYQEKGWYMQPLQPTLRAKIVFITDGRAISFAESYLGYIEGYQLATIVGQPTAGTNGNVNPFMLPGGYLVTWTGMRVLKHDGSQHHGVGIIPHVLVERTIKGIKAGHDEFLEKAIEIAKQ